MELGSFMRMIQGADGLLQAEPEDAYLLNISDEVSKDEVERWEHLGGLNLW